MTPRAEAAADTAPEQPQNPLYERYASREMAAIFSSSHRFATWRRIWILLARSEAALGLPIRPEQIAALEAAAPLLDLARVAEIERQTRHDVVAHLRHFAEQADAVEKGAGGILHLGATSAFITSWIRPSNGRLTVSSSSSTDSWGGRKLNGAFGSSSERSALFRASGKLRPNAIASPTDFMWVVSVSSAVGNFSNANRGTLTTT